MSEIVMPLVQVWISTFVLGLAFALVGREVFRRGFPADHSDGRLFTWGASFFLGLYLYLFLFRGLALVLGSARGACYLALGFVLVLGARGASRDRSGLGPWVRWSAAGFLVFTIFNALFRLTPEKSVYLLSSFGSLHGGRYSNVGLFVVETNQVPRLSQNYGQSLLVATQLFLGVGGPLAGLTAWLSLSGAALALLLFGAFRKLGLPPVAAGAGVFFVLCCNIALSLQWVYIIDSGSPLGLSGYTDTMSALATWLLLLFWMQATASRALTMYSLLFPTLLAVGWTMTGPQNNVIAMAMLGQMVMLSAGARRRLEGLTAAVVVGTVAGALQGGMLMPAGWASDTGMPGMMSPYEAFYRGGVTGMLPDLPYAVRRGDTLTFWFQLLDEHRFPQPMFLLETKFWQSLRLLFFPIAGLAGLAAWSRWGKPRDSKSASSWVLWGTASLFPGFMASFWFLYHGYKWELVRFLLPGILTGLVAFVWLIHEAGEVLSPAARCILWGTALAAGTFGPITTVSGCAYRNFVGPAAEKVSVAERLRLLLVPGRIPAHVERSGELPGEPKR